MSLHGIGVDVLHLPRIVSLCSRRRSGKLASRILSMDEMVVFNTLAHEEQRQARFLAVRWAVKEAAYKALYPVRPTWKELTFTSLINGIKPTLYYHPGSTTTNGSVANTNWITAEKTHKLHVSVSHDGDYVFASVVAVTWCVNCFFILNSTKAYKRTFLVLIL
ncbi:4'-phosphopantetheinyl transferase superfamily-domain-containing protein [Hygrophoropsis aurantiaca]|uniref:4'-phosphopantetheinyl transferase superfamily-domain-containing protein n=1 Tax=Hygrophoropsis aurantiaca TaxID=72124 RepID=A0ACB8A9G5_9AGAM|nr:4'-phosphopantetheinyl transferase superfamily-domain-containing protein [Hygrophoropsis aurantiaca]